MTRPSDIRPASTSRALWLILAILAIVTAGLLATGMATWNLDTGPISGTDHKIGAGLCSQLDSSIYVQRGMPLNVGSVCFTDR